MWFEKVREWEGDGTKIKCRGITKSADLLTGDVLSVTIPRKCLGDPDELRWAGYVGDISRATDESFTGNWDDFPRLQHFATFWAY